jgi:hypothetical protein
MAWAGRYGKLHMVSMWLLRGGAGKMGIRRTLLAALELPCLTLTRQSFGF